jgi:hypothetical protein
MPVRPKVAIAGSSGSTRTVIERVDAIRYDSTHPMDPAIDTSVETFLHRLRANPDQIEFADTIAAIERAYAYTPTAFRNGDTHNVAGQNGGSCKIFAFAKLHGLTEAETLACFGRYYREDVLPHPGANDHQNIRNFMRSGWQGIAFEGDALALRGV